MIVQRDENRCDGRQQRRMPGISSWLDFSPQSERETQGPPALVMTPRRYSIATGLALVVPLATKAKGRTLEVPVRGGKRANGVMLANELRTVDYAARRAEKFDTCPPDVLADVRAIAEALVRG
jgi:mRNA interferase MazF